jgi:hypothetical protein
MPMANTCTGGRDCPPNKNSDTDRAHDEIDQVRALVECRLSDADDNAIPPRNTSPAGTGNEHEHREIRPGAHTKGKTDGAASDH